MANAGAKDVLFELGCEELPPKSLLKLRDALVAGVHGGLAKADLAFREIKGYAAPRRLAVQIAELSPKQPDKIVERRGPAVAACYKNGEPTPALMGFLSSSGASLDDVQILKTDKGEWVTITQNLIGAASVDMLPGILRDALNGLPVAKRMRWGDLSVEFVRPVHWVVLLYGEDVVPAEFFGLTTDRLSRGHRFHHPESIAIASPGDYAATLEQQGRVLADFETRRERILTLVEQAAAENNGRAIWDADLLDEVASLSEWPVPIVAGFEERYLAVPREALIATMQGNQKYFPLESPDGQLLPRFVTIANLASARPDAIREGNERVVRPRLADAEFFWNQDRQRGLEAMAGELATVIFQDKLGTLADKVARMADVVRDVAGAQGVSETELAAAIRAGALCKADLRSAMVGEFPELQGTMGRYYALAQGESAAVALAIEEHYWPRHSGGALPASIPGQLLSLAERIDTLTGIFAISLIPTGDKDPYGLRRAALGVVRIVVESGYDFDLKAILESALRRAPVPVADGVIADLWDFVLERMRGYCLDRDFAPDEWEAVTAVAGGNLLDIAARLEAVRAFRKLPEAVALAAANKRIRNILRKSEDQDLSGLPEIERCVEPEELNLYHAARRAGESVAPLLERRDYTRALQELAGLREPADAFFDKVLVNAEEESIRHNRFRLLALVENTFRQIADIGKLQA